jgi:hypothetical protein
MLRGLAKWALGDEDAHKSGVVPPEQSTMIEVHSTAPEPTTITKPLSSGDESGSDSDQMAAMVDDDSDEVEQESSDEEKGTAASSTGTEKRRTNAVFFGKASVIAFGIYERMEALTQRPEELESAKTEVKRVTAGLDLTLDDASSLYLLYGVHVMRTPDNQERVLVSKLCALMDILLAMPVPKFKKWFRDQTKSGLLDDCYYIFNLSTLAACYHVVKNDDDTWRRVDTTTLTMVLRSYKVLTLAAEKELTLAFACSITGKQPELALLVDVTTGAYRYAMELDKMASEFPGHVLASKANPVVQFMAMNSHYQEFLMAQDAIILWNTEHYKMTFKTFCVCYLGYRTVAKVCVSIKNKIETIGAPSYPAPEKPVIVPIT